MLNYITFSELPKREKEKVMLLLASADDHSWRAVHDPPNRLHIEWHVSPTHPVLSFLPLSSASPTCEQTSPHVRRQTPRARGTSFSQQNSPSRNGRAAVDCSPWTIDLNNEGSNVLDTGRASQLLGHVYSPSMREGLQAKAETASSATRRGCLNSSMGSRGSASPFLNARSVFLRRQGRRSTSQRLPAPPVDSWERRGSRRNVASNVVSSTGADAIREASSQVATVRSAQWVSRLVEDIMSYVSRMVALDDQAHSVAALTVTILMTRYGACQWNRVLRDLAEGLHKYRTVSPLCRVFQELFINESPSAMEDLFLLSQLHRATVRHSIGETQKVVFPLTKGDDAAKNSSIQHTIVARRYLELRQLTAVLNDVLSAVSVTDNRAMGTVRVLRRRKLRLAEIIGVKTIVAYWIEDESSNNESLAFDLGGFVDMHEVLDVVVSTLGSKKSRGGVATSRFHLQKKREKEEEEEEEDGVNDDADEKEEGGKSAVVVGNAHRLYGSDCMRRKVAATQEDGGSDKGEEAMSYAARARLIMQRQGRESENTLRRPVAQTAGYPLLPPSWTVPSHSAHASIDQANALTPRNGSIKASDVSSAILHGATDKDQEVLRGERPVGERRGDQASGKTPVAIWQETAVVPGARSSAPLNHSHHDPHQRDDHQQQRQKKADEPVIVDLDQKHNERGEQLRGGSPPLGVAETHVSGERGKDVTGAQAQQYLAALAAIDVELQRRREVLQSVVALDLSAHNEPQAAPEELETTLHSAPRPVPHRDDGPSSIPRSVERSPNHAGGFPELAGSDVTANLEEPMESSEPPANASTFANAVLHSATRKYSPMSILLPSKYQVSEKAEERRGKEDKGNPNDMELLTLEERQLLADLQRALKHQR